MVEFSDLLSCILDGSTELARMAVSRNVQPGSAILMDRIIGSDEDALHVEGLFAAVHSILNDWQKTLIMFRTSDGETLP